MTKLFNECLVLLILQFAPYCSSKWAVEGLSKCIAKGLPDGMAIVALNPGSIHTDMLHLCLGDSAAQFQSPHKWYINSFNLFNILFYFFNFI